MEMLRQYGLVVDEAEDGGDLEYCESWNAAAIDAWLRKLFPKAFQWLDLKAGALKKDEKYHWVLLGKEYKKFFTVQRENTTGKEITKVRGSMSGRRFTETCIFFGMFFSTVDAV